MSGHPAIGSGRMAATTGSPARGSKRRNPGTSGLQDTGAGSGNAYVYHQGYWGEQVGFYGGVNYGYGYPGHGYEGGHWDHNQYYYNQSVNNVNTTVVHNVYNTTNTTVINNNTTVINNTTNVTRVSYNGGNGGVEARATPEEESVAQAHHIPPVAAQAAHVQAARSNPQLRVSANQGKPPIAATSKPGAFTEAGVVEAKEGGTVHTAPAQPQNQPQNQNQNQNQNHPQNTVARPNKAVHPADLPPARASGASNTGDQKRDQQYQQDQQKLVAQQAKERQQLQQKQDQEHQQLTQKKPDDPANQKLEQQHAQQTQQLAQKHTKQMQDLQAHQQPKHDQGGQKEKP